MSEQGYKSSSIDQKTSLLKRYYYELYEKHYGEGKLFFLFSGIKILPFFFFLSGLFLVTNLRTLFQLL